jgi:hypothetical protein
MPYTPPAGNAVNLNFSGAYTQPLGNAVNINFVPGGYTFNLDPGIYALNGTNVSLRAGRKLTLASGSYVINGTALTPFRGYAIIATPGVYTIVGANVSLVVARYLSAAPGVYTINGAVVGLRYGRLMTATPGVYALLGSAVALRYGHAILATPGVYTITGTDPALLWKRILRIAPGVYTQVRTDVSLRYGRRINVVPGVYQLNGKSLIFTYHEVTKIVADEGVYTLVGGDVTFIYNRRLTVTPGAYLIQGHAPQMVASRRLVADPGSYALNGTDVTMTQGGRTLGADSGVYRLVGGDARMTVARRMSLAPGSYAVAGTAVQLLAARRMALGSGIYTIVDTPNFAINYVNNSLLTNSDGSWYFGDRYGLVRNATRVATGDLSLPFAFEQTDPLRDAFVGQNNDLVWAGPGGLELQGSPAPPFDQLTLSWKIKPAFAGQEFAINVFWYTDTTFITTTGFLEFPTDTSQFGSYSAVVTKPPGALHFLIEAVSQLGGVGYFGDIRLDGFAPMKMIVGRRLSLSSGVYALTGHDLTSRRGYNIHVVPGVYALNGAPVALLADRLMNVGSRAFHIVWATTAQITYHRTPPGPRCVAVDPAPIRYVSVDPLLRRVSVDPQDRRLAVDPAVERYAGVEPLEHAA